MMVVNNKFKHGDTVYLKTDSNQYPRIVIAFTIYKAGEIMYKLVSGTISSDHYDYEIATEKDVTLATTN